MGEIAEALRRANAEREDQPEASSPPGAAAVEAPARVYTESEARYRSQRSGAAGPDAPPSPQADLVCLTHQRRESLPPQGVLVDDGGAVTEACFQFALRVRASLEDRLARTLLVVSAVRSEGKTTVACNLALALAALSRGRRVALVDLDLRRPSVAAALELQPPDVGIEAVIEGGDPLERARVSALKPELDVYPALRPRPSAHELLILPGLAASVRELEARYDVTVFDSPPSLLVPDANLILEQVAAFIPLARAGRTRARTFRRMLETFPKRQLLGTVLNDAPPSLQPRHYGYYHYEPADAAG